MGMVGRKWPLSRARYAFHHRREMELFEDTCFSGTVLLSVAGGKVDLTDWLTGCMTD
jgi:hypothetical protein